MSTVLGLPHDRTIRLSECAEFAATTRDPLSKHTLEKTAEHWKALADGIEKYEPRDWEQAAGAPARPR